MSPLLKSRVPSGSLAGEHVKSTPKAQNKVLAQGWRMGTLETVSTNLLAKSKSIQETSKQGEVFWEAVDDLKNKGWSIFKHPQLGLCVDYSFVSLGSRFQPQAVAQIVQEMNGMAAIRVDSNEKIRQRLSLSISGLDGTILSTSINTPIDLEEVEDLDKNLLLRRDLQFDGELWVHLQKESRLLLNQGVIADEDTIVARLANSTSITIYKVTIEGNIADLKRGIQEEEPSTLGDVHLAEKTLAFIRLLLSYHHFTIDNAFDKSKPILDRRKPPTVPWLLRPIVAITTHVHLFKAIIDFLYETVHEFDQTNNICITAYRLSNLEHVSSGNHFALVEGLLSTLTSRVIIERSGNGFQIELRLPCGPQSHGPSIPHFIVLNLKNRETLHPESLNELKHLVQSKLEILNS
jgi:hypothetical protein